LSDDPFIFLSKKQRSKIFSKVKKNQNRLILKNYQGIGEGLDIAFAIDEKSAKRESGRPTFVGEQDRQFYRHLIFELKDRVTIDILFYDSIAIAYSINFVYGKIYHAFKTDYDKNFRYLSPGKLILFFLLPRLKQEGFKMFDFSRGANVLKREFTPLAYPQYDLYYARNVFIRSWWKINLIKENFKERLLENERFYNKYLWVKRFLVTLRLENKSER
jgi:hypothetical protein